MAELGIVRWRARVERACAVTGELSGEQPGVMQGVTALAASSAGLVEAPFDLCFHADACDAAEAELLGNIIQGVRDRLRSDLRIESFALHAARAHASVHFRLDDVDFPSLATMLAQPSSKRALWQALQEAVARLP